MDSERVLFQPADISGILGDLIPAPRGGAVPSTLAPVSAVEVDSRRCRRGSLFVALKGERTDGHLHIGDAYERGARVFVVKAGEPRVVVPGTSDALFIEVKDPLTALQALAFHHLSGLPDVYRIGITGSNGKTTTKEIVGSILSRAARTAMNRGNLNSEIGLPLAAFEVSREDRFAVFEMAMDHEGEMDILSRIVQPQSALVTNIGTAHVGRLGSVHAIAAEKKKIFSRFTGTEKAFIPEHDLWFSFLSERVRGRVIPYGVVSTRGFQGVVDRGIEGTVLKWRGRQIHLPLPGRHNVLNALGAVTLADELGIAPEAIREGIECVPRLFGRSEILKGRVTLIQDCYNANPDSMGKALEFVSGLSCTGKKILVLGSMKELGESTIPAHEALGTAAAGTGAARVFFFGEEARTSHEALLASGFTGTSFWTEDMTVLISRVREVLREGDLVLVKGSRAVALERLAEDLVKTEGLVEERAGGGCVS